MLATRHSHTWINKYIFPGGFLPSVRAIDEVTRRDTTLRVTRRLSFGAHYGETLRQWEAAFRAATDEVRALGFDPTVERMWHFYLEYSRAGSPPATSASSRSPCAGSAAPIRGGGGAVVSDLLLVSGASFVLAAAAMSLTAAVARRIGRVSVVDVTWGLGLASVALVCAVLGSGWVPWLLTGLVWVWGGRLSWHIFRRARGHGEDPRYAATLGDVSPDGDRAAWFRAAVGKVFVIQGVAIWFVSWPLQAAAVRAPEWPGLVWIGAAVWGLGFVFEAVGDAQLAAYKRDPSRGPVMDRGLWAWTRHPNYFGDACVWWGIWLAGALSAGWLPGLVTLPAPIAMTYFLAFTTGARLLETSMMRRPGYPEYAARTPMLFPRPPRRHRV